MDETTKLEIQRAARAGASLEDLLAKYSDEDIDEAVSPGRCWDGDLRRWCWDD